MPKAPKKTSQELTQTARVPFVPGDTGPAPEQRRLHIGAELEAVAGGVEWAWMAKFLRALPPHIDDITSEFGDDLYERMLRDPKVYQCAETLKLQALASGITLQPAIKRGQDGYEKALEMRDFCQAALDQMKPGILTAVYDLLDAVSYGNRAGEIIYHVPVTGKCAGKLVPARIKAKPRRAVAYVIDAFNNLQGVLGLIPNQYSFLVPGSLLPGLKVPNLLPRRKFAILTMRSEGGDPRGRSLLRPAYNPWWLKRNVDPLELKWLAQWAVPSMFVTLPEDAAPTSQIDPATGEPVIDPATGRPKVIDPTLNMELQVRKFQSGSYMIAPFGSTATPISAGSENGGPFDNFYKRCDNGIEYAITHQTLSTSEGEHMSRAAATEHGKTKGNVVAYVRTVTEEMIREDILREIVLLNFGEQALPLVPKVSLSEAGDEEFREAAPALTQLWNGGQGYMSPSQIEEMDARLGLPERSQEELELIAAAWTQAKQQAAQPPQEPGAPGEPGEGGQGGGGGEQEPGPDPDGDPETPDADQTASSVDFDSLMEQLTGGTQQQKAGAAKFSDSAPKDLGTTADGKKIVRWIHIGGKNIPITEDHAGTKAEHGHGKKIGKEHKFPSFVYNALDEAIQAGHLQTHEDILHTLAIAHAVKDAAGKGNEEKQLGSSAVKTAAKWLGSVDKLKEAAQGLHGSDAKAKAEKYLQHLDKYIGHDPEALGVGKAKAEPEPAKVALPEGFEESDQGGSTWYSAYHSDGHSFNVYQLAAGPDAGKWMADHVDPSGNDAEPPTTHDSAEDALAAAQQAFETHKSAPEPEPEPAGYSPSADWKKHEGGATHLSTEHGAGSVMSLPGGAGYVAQAHGHGDRSGSLHHEVHPSKAEAQEAVEKALADLAATNPDNDSTSDESGESEAAPLAIDPYPFITADEHEALTAAGYTVVPDESNENTTVYGHPDGSQISADVFGFDAVKGPTGDGTIGLDSVEDALAHTGHTASGGSSAPSESAEPAPNGATPGGGSSWTVSKGNDPNEKYWEGHPTFDVDVNSTPPDALKGSGLILVDPDTHEVYIHSPKGAYGGYQNTFAKGGLEKGLTSQQNALKELYEEQGLKGDIKSHLGFFTGDTGTATYFVGTKTGGSPDQFGDETEAVHKVSLDEAEGMLNKPKDKAIIAALKQHLAEHEAWKGTGPKAATEAEPTEGTGTASAPEGLSFTPAFEPAAASAPSPHKITWGSLTPAGSVFGGAAQEYELEDTEPTAQEISEAKAAVSPSAQKYIDQAMSNGTVKTFGDLNQFLAIAEAHSKSEGKNYISGYGMKAAMQHKTIEGLKKAAEAGDANAKKIVDQLGPHTFKTAAESFGSMTAEELLHKKGAVLGGSNSATLYETPSGEKHVVKKYGAATQAYGEHVSNQILTDLGISSPKSTVIPHNGQYHYASQYVDGITHAGLNPKKADAKAFLDNHFVANAFLGNWDAIGLTGDNLVKLPDGKLHQIDNGGSLLHKAQGGLKSEEYLGKLHEFKTLAPGDKNINPAFGKYFSKAGYSSVEDIPNLEGQMQKVLALGKGPGGWAAYVDKAAPGAPADVKQKLTGALEKRAAAMQANLDRRLKKKLGNSKVYSESFAYEPTKYAETKQLFSTLLSPKMTEAQKKAVGKYKGASYQGVNGYLEGKDGYESYKAQAENIKKAYSHPEHVAPHNMILSRKVHLYGDAFDIFANAAPGTITQFAGAQSTAMSSAVWSGNVHFMVHLPKGAPALAPNNFTGTYDSEKEVLLAPGAKFRIIAVDKAGDESNTATHTPNDWNWHPGALKVVVEVLHEGLNT